MSQASFNSRTGVKVLRTSFPMFKFPGEPQLNLKCRVNVCRKNCPVTKCSADASSTQASSTAVVIDKFQLETSAMVEDNSRIKNRLESVLKKKKAREAKRRREEEEEEEEEKRILSVEERKEAEEAFIEQQALLEREEGPSVVQKQLPILEDQQLLCLSPSRLILAFGVILFILLLALVFACMLCYSCTLLRLYGGGGGQP